MEKSIVVFSVLLVLSIGALIVEMPSRFETTQNIRSILNK